MSTLRKYTLFSLSFSLTNVLLPFKTNKWSYCLVVCGVCSYCGLLNGGECEHLIISSSESIVSWAVSLSQKLHCGLKERSKPCSAYMWKCHIPLHWESYRIWKAVSCLHQRDDQDAETEQLKAQFCTQLCSLLKEAAAHQAHKFVSDLSLKYRTLFKRYLDT